MNMKSAREAAYQSTFSSKATSEINQDAHKSKSALEDFTGAPVEGERPPNKGLLSPNEPDYLESHRDGNFKMDSFQNSPFSMPFFGDIDGLRALGFEDSVGINPNLSMLPTLNMKYHRNVKKEQSAVSMLDAVNDEPPSTGWQELKEDNAGFISCWHECYNTVPELVDMHETNVPLLGNTDYLKSYDFGAAITRDYHIPVKTVWDRRLYSVGERGNNCSSIPVMIPHCCDCKIHNFRSSPEWLDIYESNAPVLDDKEDQKCFSIEDVVPNDSQFPIKSSKDRKHPKGVGVGSSTLSVFSDKNVSSPSYTFKKQKIPEPSLAAVMFEKPDDINPSSVNQKMYEEENAQFIHPFEWELHNFQPQPELLEIKDPIASRHLENTPLIYVDNKESLKTMYNEIKNQKELAIHLKNHSYRCYRGFLCLLQISTRETDYIVDCFKLNQELHILNEIFINPHIIKVFHDASMAILWLQRDFNIYVVNMFDIKEAAMVLNFTHYSLPCLMKYFCGVRRDKQSQGADWKIRPLPKQLLKYAREDTHYLLYMYDRMRNMLLKRDNNLKKYLSLVHQRSTEICLKKYHKVSCVVDEYLDIYRKSNKNFNARQMYCLKELFMWRIRTAKIERQNPCNILSDQMLLQICEVLPRNYQEIAVCCIPTPPFVQLYSHDISFIVSKAHDCSLTQLLLLH